MLRPIEPAGSQILLHDGTFGLQSNLFGFSVPASNSLSIVIEATSNLLAPDWQPLQTNLLGPGHLYFSDPTWTNYPNRFYRLRVQ